MPLWGVRSSLTLCLYGGSSPALPTPRCPWLCCPDPLTPPPWLCHPDGPPPFLLGSAPLTPCPLLLGSATLTAPPPPSLALPVPQLDSLKLGWCKVGGQDGARAVQDLVMFAPTLKLLDLRGNSLGNDGVIHLSRCVCGVGGGA